MYVNRTDLASRNVSEEKRSFCKTESCRRAFLLDQFNQAVEYFDHHRCCDTYLNMCDCPTCQMGFDHHGAITRRVLPANVELVGKSLLESYFDQVNGGITNSLFPEAVTGLSKDIIPQLLDLLCEDIDYATGLTERFPGIHQDYRTVLQAIFSHINSL